jgi:hypothetical protein
MRITAGRSDNADENQLAKATIIPEDITAIFHLSIIRTPSHNEHDANPLS